jgi:lipopolysaccharide export system permease protein
MSLIDRYLFRQILGPSFLALLALSGVAILSESLSALDLLVDQRQSPLIFLKAIALAMPQLIALVLPIAVLIGTLTAMNRLHTEQETVVMFAAGVSRWRVLAPGLQMAGLASLLALILTLWVQPMCFRHLREVLQSIRTDLAASLIRPGKFTHPAPGVTVFAQSVDDGGVIRNLFINRVNAHGQDDTVTAGEGRLTSRGGRPILIMRHGSNQRLSADGGLNFLAFDEYALDLGAFITPDRTVLYKLSDRYPHELFFPDLSVAWDRANQRKMLAEGHSRFAAPLYNVSFVAVAIAAVIGGPFSRFGYGVRIALAAVAALVARGLGFGLQAAAGGAPSANVWQYALPLGVLALALVFLFSTPGPRRTLSGSPAS